jgi:hypothetical protein
VPDIETSPPVFETLEEALEYGQRFQYPQGYIDDFAGRVMGGVSFSSWPRYDSRLAACGSAVVTGGREAIKIGRRALIRDTELFRTLAHEEIHLRLMRKARLGNRRALDLVTDPDPAVEEDYAERVAERFLKKYERMSGRFRH